MAWDVSAGTSRTISAVLAAQIVIVWGLVLLAVASAILFAGSRHAAGETHLELWAILLLVIAVPILGCWSALRVLSGSGGRRAIALVLLFDPAHPERTILDYGSPWRYTLAATGGFFAYAGAVFALDVPPDLLVGVAFVGGIVCYGLWWSLPSRGYVDGDRGELVLYNRRLLTEGGSGRAWNLVRGFSDEDRVVDVDDVVSTSALPVGDLTVLVLRHESGLGPTVVAVPRSKAGAISRSIE